MGDVLKTLNRGGVRSVAWDVRGERLASGSDDNSMQLWDASTGEVSKTLERHRAGVRSVAWDVRGDGLFCAMFDGGIAFHADIDDPDVRTPRAYLHGVGSSHLPVTPDGFVDGDLAGLSLVPYSDGLALYDLTDLPTRHSPERPRSALAPPWSKAPRSVSQRRSGARAKRPKPGHPSKG